MSAGSRYTWPMLTVVDPEDGSFEFHVHGVRDGRSPAVTLVVFGNAAPSVKQADTVRSLARRMEGEIVQLEQGDIPESLGVFLAAKVRADPGKTTLIVPGGQWGIDGAGRKVVPQ